MREIPIFSINELIKTLQGNAILCCDHHGSIDRKAVPAEESFPRNTTGCDIIDRVTEHAQLNIKKRGFSGKYDRGNPE